MRSINQWPKIKMFFLTQPLFVSNHPKDWKVWDFWVFSTRLGPAAFFFNGRFGAAVSVLCSLRLRFVTNRFGHNLVCGFHPIHSSNRAFHWKAYGSWPEMTRTAPTFGIIPNRLREEQKILKQNLKSLSLMFNNVSIWWGSKIKPKNNKIHQISPRGRVVAFLSLGSGVQRLHCHDVQKAQSTTRDGQYLWIEPHGGACSVNVKAPKMDGRTGLEPKAQKIDMFRLGWNCSRIRN